MTEFLSQVRLDQVKCEQHDQIANFICLDKECQKKGITCPICQNLYHKDHQVKALKYFLHQLAQSQSRSNKIVIISAEIDLVVSQLRQAFSKVADIEDRNQLQKTFSSYMNQLYTRVNNQFEIQKDLREFFENSNNLTVKRINQFINKFQLHQFQPEEPSDKPLSNQEKFLYQMLDVLKQKKDDYLNLTKAKTQIKDILGLFIFTSVKEKLNFVFSEELKHTAIKIIDKLTAKQQHNYSSNFALIQPMIIGKKKTLDKKTVKIKIDKLNSWVNLGVCVKSKVTSAAYYFNTQDIGHGAYTISNDGYSWHNTDSSSNSHYHTWNFVQGDIVTMTYDPKTKTIKYSKQNCQKQHELSCEPIPGEEMYFCVTLNTHDECVSIVQ